MIRIGIVGASGYTGVELARLLCSCPDVKLTVATSRQYKGVKLADVYPNLAGMVDIVCEDPETEYLVDRADLFFTAVPHQTAMAIVPDLLQAGKKVVDLSADFRIHDAAAYEKWYQKHTAQEYLAEAVYGLPELHRQEIAEARLVANPGCYPTSVILGLAPLLQAGVIDPETIIVDSKSGASGAGRLAQTGTLFCEVAEGFKAYKVAAHRHTPEMEQEISELCKKKVTISFTPHLLPMSRGILSTIYAKLTKPVTDAEVNELYASFYKNEFFVRLAGAGNYPATQFVRGSNFCDIGFKIDNRTGRIVVLSAIDNLVKGAAGQAVQNMNLMCNLPETRGTSCGPIISVSGKRNIKLLLAFDGTAYAGWQRQKSEMTIQGMLEDKIHVMTGENSCVHGAGRTDAGVHALGMVANFETGAAIPCPGLVNGLNSMLPSDIRVLEASEVDADFHARRNARAKTYWYNLTSGPVQLPTERLYSTHVFEKLDIDAMRKGLAHVVGTHDFSSFEGAGSRDQEFSGRGAVRTILEAAIETVGSEDRLCFVITGDGFLRHMVRNIVGTMIEVGKGRLAQSDIAAVLGARDRSKAGPTAPARGLFLKEVLYS